MNSMHPAQCKFCTLIRCSSKEAQVTELIELFFEKKIKTLQRASERFARSKQQLQYDATIHNMMMKLCKKLKPHLCSEHPVNHAYTMLEKLNAEMEKMGFSKNSKLLRYSTNVFKCNIIIHLAARLSAAAAVLFALSASQSPHNKA